MSLLFKEVYKTILKIERNLEQSIPLKDTLYHFWISKLFLVASKSKDNNMTLDIIRLTTSLDLEKNFQELVSLFEVNKKEFLEEKIFLVFGRNKDHFEIVKNCIEESGFLCDYLDVDKIEGGTQIIYEALIEKISYSFKAVVVFSADDEGKLINSEGGYIPRPRLNVVLEAGLSCGILSPENVILLWDANNSLDLMTDILGFVRIDIKEDGVWKEKLKNKLLKFNLDWQDNYF